MRLRANQQCRFYAILGDEILKHIAQELLSAARFARKSSRYGTFTSQNVGGGFGESTTLAHQ
jgi:hypothetical protein